MSPIEANGCLALVGDTELPSDVSIHNMYVLAAVLLNTQSANPCEIVVSRDGRPQRGQEWPTYVWVVTRRTIGKSHIFGFLREQDDVSVRVHLDNENINHSLFVKVSRRCKYDQIFHIFLSSHRNLK